MLSHRDRMRDVDTFCVTAQRLLSLAPSQMSSCSVAGGPSTPAAPPPPAATVNGNVRQSRSYTEGFGGPPKISAPPVSPDPMENLQISYLSYLIDAKNGMKTLL